MKALVLLMLIILVFLGCALIGFQVANKQDKDPAEKQPAVSVSEITGEQHNVLIMRVDELDSPQPQLISVWFVSLFFLEDNPTKLTLAQIYPSNSAKAGSLEETFALTGEGEPTPAFWDALEAYGFNWESYVVLDTAGANQFLQWLVGPVDFIDALAAAASNPESNSQMVDQICKSIADASNRELGEFNWSAMIPDHFRSDMRLEAGLAYWDRLVDNGPARCEILPSPK
jgi:hypothetical protein